ncbi:MAG: polysaccharide deacetylase family protein [Cyanobacteria bacterium SBLK]|nr:polysaccharide deacetylase family protein [Cyanobacteria bacterium SBLK]
MVGLSVPAGRAAHQYVAKSTPELGAIAPGLAGLPILATNNVKRLEKEAARAAKLTDFPVPKQFQGKTINDVKLKGDRKVIALTFDDGPAEEFTNNILYILDSYNIKATFFLLGRNVREYPARAKHIHLKGHALANHSWSHPYHAQSPAGAAAQIDNTDFWIQKATGVRPKLFRPPGGFLHNGMAAYAARKGQVVVMWSADSKDYYASPQGIAKRVLSEASPGGIVLFHDGGGDRANTVNALPYIINQLKEQGYEFVTVPELLEMKEQETKQAGG